MTRSATAIAHPNIALAKYWGKRPGDGNIPAVPSLSVTLAGMSTTTTVSFDDTLVDDELVLNGAQAESSRPKVRASQLLDRVRAAASTTSRARVVSVNDFPTASGLASSASGFAALALAAVRAAGLDWSAEQVADLARRSSASAARSVFGGFVELDGGEAPDGTPSTGMARAVAGPSAIDLRVLVCVTTEAAKATSSTDGMRLTQEISPYYAAWVADAPSSQRAIRAALLAGDFVRLGELSERSALAMHACAMAAGIVYMTGATLSVLQRVRELRAAGLPAFATVDAGPHLKCLVRSGDAAAARENLQRVPGVLRIIDTSPGEGARIVEPASAVGAAP
ncbi:MAG TPA: diphosphomevalonate decarboxylase [Labilithrix sp.]|nr:diphosphomevalonate decarboxylase [Labilithrix sp.]